MKKQILIAFSTLIWVFTSLNAQTDTAKTKSVDNAAAPARTGPIIKTGPGTNGKDTVTGAGVAVSPSSMHFRCKPGRSETMYLTITNDQNKSEKFKISFQDYTMDNFGQTRQIPFGEIAPYGLSRYIVAAPTVVELKAGEKKKVAITVSMPENDDAYKASWTLMMVDKLHERSSILPDKENDKTMHMGVIPTYGFGIHIYQNPPNVRLNKVEILSFNFNYNDTAKFVSLKVKNSGDGMGFCKSYLEINNTKTGKVEKNLLKQFVVFPGNERYLESVVPGKLEKGTYSILLVLDFGSKEQLEVAEQEVVVQ